MFARQMLRRARDVIVGSALLALLAPLFGLIAALIKVLGGPGRYLRREHPEIAVRPHTLAVRRTALGAFVDLDGLLIGGLFIAPQHPAIWHAVPMAGAYVLLVMVRAGVWRLVLQGMIKRGPGISAFGDRLLGHVALGTVWSSFLDLVGGLLTIAALPLMWRLFMRYQGL